MILKISYLTTICRVTQQKIIRIAVFVLGKKKKFGKFHGRVLRESRPKEENR